MWGFTGHLWIPLTKANDAELWYFFICSWINGWVNNCEAGVLRRHRAHYHVIVMQFFWTFVYKDITIPILSGTSSHSYDHDDLLDMAWRLVAIATYKSSYPRQTPVCSIQRRKETIPYDDVYLYVILVVFCCFILLILTLVTLSKSVCIFIDILNGCITGTRAIAWLPSSHGATLGNTGKLDRYQALTIWVRDKTDAILLTTFSNAFSWLKLFQFSLLFHWSLFPRVQLTIYHGWFR